MSDHQFAQVSSRKSLAHLVLRCYPSQVTDDMSLVPSGIASSCPSTFSVPFIVMLESLGIILLLPC